MKFRTEALILREQSIGEKDKIVTVLSKEKGLFRGFIRGAKNIKSQNCPGSQLFSYSRIFASESKGNYMITEAKSQEMFMGIRNSVEGMALAQYLCELTLSLLPMEEPHDDVLKLLLNSLYLISKEKKELLIIKGVFEMRLMMLLGYMPDLIMCPKCGKYENNIMRFIPSTGQLYCDTCTDYGIPMEKGAFTALRHSIYAEDNMIFSFSLSDNSLKEFSTASENYIMQKTEREFKTLSFFKSMCT